MHRFFHGLLGIVQLYLILVLLLLILFFIISNIEPIVLNLVFMIILTIGVFIDVRFNYKSKIIIVIFSVIQLLLYYYLELIPILLVKDLFWFFVALNISFIWHVLVLHWCFEISLKYKWDYGCYLFSSISIITSLTGIYWIFNWISFLVNWIGDYFHWIINIKKKEFQLTKTERLISKFKCLNYPINLIISIIKAIILYFMMIFKNYCLLLLGKHNNLFWKLPMWFYLRFLILCIISIYLMIPRIYIIWVILFLLKTVDVLQKTIKARIYSKNWRFILWFVVIQSEIIGNLVTEPGFDLDWDVIYNKEYYLDYLIFCENLDWFFSDFVL